MKERLARALTISTLLLAGVLGLRSGLDDLAIAQTALQKSVTYGVLAYGVLSFVAAGATVAGKRWAIAVTTLWGVIVVYVATGATIAYGGADGTGGAAIGSGIASAAVAGALIWSVAWCVGRAGRRAGLTTVRME